MASASARPPVRSFTPDDATVVLIATLPIARDGAYRAFTDPTELARWFWPERLAAVYSGMAAPGGALRVRSEVANLGVTAAVRDLVPDCRLAVDWLWDGDSDATDVLVEFADSESDAEPDAAIGSETAVRVTHSGNPSVVVRDEHQTGWTDCLTRLVGYRP